MKTASFRPQITPQFVARALGLSLAPSILAGSVEFFTAVTSDSRKVIPGCLFIALKGDNFDGHQFIATALQQGAKAIVALRTTSIKDPQGAMIFAVDDTLDAYRRIAHAWRKEFSIPMIAVAGSVGKTTTKELLTAILGGKFSNVLKTQGSQNGFVGIPMTLFDLTPDHQAAVIEVGIDEIGAMKQHMELVSATASVLTTIGPEHLEKLRDIPTVAQEEGLALTMVAQTGGLIAISLDDPWIKPYAKTIRSGTKLTYALSDETADLKGDYLPDSNVFELTDRRDSGNLRKDRFTLPLPGIHNARNTLAAIAIALAVGLSAEEIQKGLQTFKMANGRSEIQKLELGGNGCVQVVCDYYNANPTSTEAGLELLSQVSKASQNSKPSSGLSASAVRFACLGDMLELGTDEEKFHRDLATTIAKQKINHVFLYGPRMKSLFDELKKRQFSEEVKHFDSHEAIASALTEKVKSGDTVLIKGSRGMKMEQVWDRLQKWANASQNS